MLLLASLVRTGLLPGGVRRSTQQRFIRSSSLLQGVQTLSLLYNIFDIRREPFNVPSIGYLFNSHALKIILETLITVKILSP